MDENTLTGHLLELSRSLDEYRAAVKKAQDHFAFEVEALWKDQADLRDEVNANVTALGNRIESVTRGLTTQPAEVAERMVGPQSFVCRVNPGCNEQHRPHVHNDDGALIYVSDDASVDRYYAERDKRDAILKEHRG